MAKKSVRKEIKAAKEILKELMQINLEEIGDKLIKDLMKEYDNLSDLNKINAIKKVQPKNAGRYTREILNALAVIAKVSLDSVKKEVPKASKVKLSDWNEDVLYLGSFDNLPAKLKKKLKAMSTLIVETQLADLKKAIMFQFNSSVDSTDSAAIIENDLKEASIDYREGTNVDAGAGSMGSTIVNESRAAFLFNDKVKEELDAYVFNNDIPKTPICIDLSNNGAGKVFEVDDPEMFRYTPPLHFNCDSYITTVLKGNLRNRKVEKLKPSKAELEKYIQFSIKETFSGRVILAEMN